MTTPTLELTLAALNELLSYRAPRDDAGTSTEVLHKKTSLRVTSGSVYVDSDVRMAA